MKRRGLRVFWYIIFCAVLSCGGKSISVAANNTDQFLQLPIASSIKVLQGWIYTMPVNGNLNHGAMDYDCEPGESIFAASDGIAMSSRQVSAVSGFGYGNFVFIKHDNEYATLYGHLHKPSEKIIVYPSNQKSNTHYSEWVRVQKGDYIGECGTSGADNVHLHFEVTTGKYAVGRVDSYDLYKTKQFYPPNASYTALGEKHLWMSDPPQYLETKIVENQVNEMVTEKKSILDTIKDWFAPREVISPESKERDTLVTEELDLSFVDKKISLRAHPTENMHVIVQAKNIGSRVWKKQEISLNVIGGREANSIFRHPTWVTDLRPALLDNTEVKPGEIGTFSVRIKSLSEGSYTVRLMAVEVGTWKQIGAESIEISIGISEEPQETIGETPTSTSKTEKGNPFEGIVRGIKEFTETVVDKVVDVIKSVPRFLGGGGGGYSSSNEHSQSVVENPVADPIVIEEQNVAEENTEVESVPEIQKEVILNEIAWSGSSGACSDHEWIELYNTSSTEQSLENWVLDIHTIDSTSTVMLTGSIGGNGYYLISHAGVFPPSTIPDLVILPNVQIPDNGARLVLKNQDGEIVDEIDQREGWLGGDTGRFPRTLERASSHLLDGVNTRWETSDSVRYGVASGVCGQITGSPGMANEGYAYVSDNTLGFYTDQAGEIVLSSEENPYLFSTFSIPQGEKVSISRGTVFAGISSDARIDVGGELVVQGSESEPVIITSRNDTEYITSTSLWNNLFTGQTPQAGDWQHITIHSEGKLTITHAQIRYGGNRYGASIACLACARSQVISNHGGSILLSHVEISNGYESGSSGKPDSLIYSDGGSVVLDQLHLHHGKRALHSEGNAEISTRSLTMHDFDLTDKVVFFQDRMPTVWEDIIFGENSPTYAYSPALVVTSSYIFSTGTQFQFSTVSVSRGATLTINEGNLYATEIKIHGNLNMQGGATKNEISGGPSSSSVFSYILFSPSSTGVLSQVRLRGGGYSSANPFTSTRPYMLWIDGASVTISNSELIDSRRPGGIMVVRNGNVVVRDSELGWYTNYNKLSSWKEYGIVGTTQSKIHIENLDFRKMDYVIELSQGATTTYARMSKDNFIELYKPELNQKNWFPQNMFPFQLW